MGNILILGLMEGGGIQLPSSLGIGLIIIVATLLISVKLGQGGDRIELDVDQELGGIGVMI